MQCDKCRKKAVIHQRYSGLHLCRDHFIADFEAKAKRAIRTHGWLTRGDHIAVDLSGGGAESALLYFLSQLTGLRRDVTLAAIIIEDWNAVNSDVSKARAFAASLGVACIPASFAEEYGITPADIGREPCSADPGNLRRPLLHRVARRQGITRLALGTSLDEEAGCVLTQLLRGTPDRLLRLPQEVAGPVSEIRPFMYAPLPEIGLYSHLRIGHNVPEPRPTPGDVFSADVRSFLREYTLGHPSAPYSLVGLSERLAAFDMPVREGVRVCDRCGGLYYDTCTVCRILEEVRCHAS